MRGAGLALLCLAAAAPVQGGLVEEIEKWIGRNLGRPYVWGSTGYKSYDCSGFVWRMAADQGLFLKRTTARKLYMLGRPLAAGEKPGFGTLVFFDNLKHVGVVKDSERFYHAQSSKGTNLSPLRPYWSGKLVGYRKLFPERP